MITPRHTSNMDVSTPNPPKWGDVKCFPLQKKEKNYTPSANDIIACDAMTDFK